MPSIKQYASLDFQSVSKLLNLPAPVNPSDAATKAYVDSAIDRLPIGTGPNELVQINSSGHLPVLDGRNLVNLPVDTELALRQALGSPVLAETIPYELAAASNGMSQGRALYSGIFLNEESFITGVAFNVGQAGVFVGNNSNHIKLYAYSAGDLTEIASTNNDESIWKTQGFRQIAFKSPLTLARGVYFIGALYNSASSTTHPTLRFNNFSLGLGETNSAKRGGLQNSVPTLPGIVNMSAITAGAIFYFGLY